jgi:enoyl-CoA hydratase/carnithine racemase
VADEPLLRVAREAGVATVTFHDPARLNAMTEAMGEAIAACARELAGAGDVRAVVLTGAGRAFSAGGDLDLIERMAREGAADPGGPTRARHRAFMRRFYGLYLALRALPQPTVAAVNGPAVGAGCCVALACDLRVAARDARLGLNFARLGIHPGMGATWTLPRLVGPARAAELLFTGRLIDGVEAERIGLVNRAVEAEAVLPEALALAREVAASAPLAVRGTKRSLARSAGSDLEAQLDLEAHEQSLCYESRDLQEGLAAARERRAPRFTGGSAPRE